MKRKLCCSDRDRVVQYGLYRKKSVLIHAKLMADAFEVETLEGVMKGNAGDYLIVGVESEMYPCKPDIFAKTYERSE